MMDADLKHSRSDDRLLRLVGEALFHPFQAFPVVNLLGFVDGLPEGYRPTVLGDLFEPGSPAVGEHEVRLGDPQLLRFLPLFHDFNPDQPL